MSQAQGEMRATPKSSDNPFFKSKYSNLATSVENAREVLAKYGLAVFQGMEDYSGTSKNAEMIFGVLRTTLAHTSGEYICSLFPLTPKNCTPLPTERNPIAQPAYFSPQAIGSAVSYARRYSFSAIINQVSGDDEDDDGNVASLGSPVFEPGAYTTGNSQPERFEPNNNAARYCTEPQVYKIGELTKGLGWDNEMAQEWLEKTTGQKTRKNLTKNQASEVIGTLLKLHDASGLTPAVGPVGTATVRVGVDRDGIDKASIVRYMKSDLAKTENQLQRESEDFGNSIDI